MSRTARLWASVFLAFLVGGIATVVGAGEKNDFPFTILGDRTGDADPKVYEQVWQEMRQFSPAFVINVGDTIQGGNDATAGAEWRAVHSVWNKYKLPQYFTPGNHDIWSAGSRKIFEQQTGHRPFYGFNYQDAHFTVLDNSQTENLSEEQMTFLARDLAANKDRNPKFVFFHKPFWLLPVMFKSSDFPFHQLVKKYGVRYVISGHGHQYKRLEEDGIVYIEAGSSGGKLKGTGFNGGWFFGQIFTRVKGLKVEMTVKEIDPPLGQGHLVKWEEMR
jgi:hypothetical protein